MLFSCIQLSKLPFNKDSERRMKSEAHGTLQYVCGALALGVSWCNRTPIRIYVGRVFTEERE